MKKKIFLSGLLIIVFTTFCTAQDVIFCERVDKWGNAFKESDHFTIGDKGGYFQILFRQKESINSTQATFDIYLKEKETEVFISSVKMNVNPDAIWFYKEVTFFKPGEYHIYIYNEKDRFLGVGKMTISKQ